MPDYGMSDNVALRTRPEMPAILSARSSGLAPYYEVYG